MTHLIDKAAVVAEIEKRIADNKKDIERASHKNLEDYFEGYEDALTLFKEQFLNTLEVKEVDLDYIKDELDRVVKIYKPNGDFGWGTLYNVATYFFELGLKVAKKD